MDILGGLVSGPVERGIRKGISEGVRQSLPGIVETILDSLWKHEAYPVIVGGQIRLMQSGVSPAEAWAMSRECLAAFLSSNGIKFGDAAYDWSADAGRVIVEEMEIDHWDSAS